MRMIETYVHAYKQQYPCADQMPPSSPCCFYSRPSVALFSSLFAEMVHTRTHTVLMMMMMTAEVASSPMTCDGADQTYPPRLLVIVCLSWAFVGPVTCCMRLFIRDSVHIPNKIGWPFDDKTVEDAKPKLSWSGGGAKQMVVDDRHAVVSITSVS